MFLRIRKHMWSISASLTAAITLLFSPISLAQDDSAQTTSSTFPKPSALNDIEEWRPHVGLIVGYTNLEKNYDSAVEYGLDVGFQPYIPFGVGLELSSSDIERTENGVDNDLKRTSLLLRGTYNFGGTIPVIRESYVGLAAGPVFESNGTELGIAPLVGFDIPIQAKPRDFVSLGLSAKYLTVSGTSPEAFAMNGLLKYWF